MKNISKKIISVFLALLLCFMTVPVIATSPVNTRTSLPTGGTKVVSWDSFYTNSKGNVSSGMTVAKNASGSGLKNYRKYMQMDVLSVTDSVSARGLNYYDDEGKLGFLGNVKANDVVLFHLICRSNSSNGKFTIAIYDTTSGHSPKVSSEDVTEKWTEYYIPVTTAYDSQRINFRIGHQIQKIELACFEVYNYGTGVSASDLPYTSYILPESEYVNDAKIIVPWNSYYDNVKTNYGPDATDDVELTKNDKDSGLSKYENYLRVNVKTAGKDITERAIDYYDSEGAYGYSGKVKTGDVLYFHIIARSNRDDGQFKLETFGAEAGDTPVFQTETVGKTWTEYFIPVTALKDDYNKINFNVGTLVQQVDIALFEVYNYYDSVAESELTHTVKVIPISEYESQGDETEVNFYDTVTGTQKTVKAADGVTDITAKEITGTVTHTFTASELLNVSNGDSLVFSFVVKAEKECTPFTITVGSSELKYFAPVQWTRIYVPVTANKLSSVSLKLSSKKLLLTEAKFNNYYKKAFTDMPELGGMYLLEDFSHVELGSESLTGAGECKDLVKTGNYIVSIGSNILAITDVTDPAKPKVVGSVSGVGKSARQVYLTEDGKYAFVTARENGVYVVNIEDKTNPYIATIYNSIEFGNGINICGKYAFIGNRTYGVQVVDISDPLNPKNVSNIMTGEAQSCMYVNGVLYCGLWGDCRVDMYDLSNPIEPKLLGKVNLNGKGDGTSVYISGGKTYLYAATGQHVPSGVGSTDPLTNLKLGQGNGMDIFDVTDPTNPVWLSTSKIDGRYYFQNNDYWDVEVSEKDGRLYAYVVNTYNGVFVFDVTDPKAPVRIAKIDVPIAFDETATEVVGSSRTIIFPYDNKSKAYSPIGAVAVSDGALYLAGAYSDLHIYRNTDYLFDSFNYKAQTEITPVGDFYSIDSTGLYKYKRFTPNGQLYRTAVVGNLIYAAAGSDGIYVLDENLDVLNNVDCVTPLGICFDLKIKDGILYAAEGSDGLVAYKIDGTLLTKQWQYVSSLGPVRDVNLSATAKFAVLSSGSSTGEIINTLTRKRLVSNSVGSQMYHRNTGSAGGGRYLGFWGGSTTKEYWYDCGEDESATTTPKLLVQYSAASAYYRSATIEYGDGVISCAKDGKLRTYNLSGSGTGKTITYLKTVSIGKNEKGTYIFGFPTINGNIMTLCDRVGGYVYFYDISDINKPVLLKSMSFTGNPDFATITKKYVLLPLGYQGLIKFDLTSLYGPIKGDVNSDGEVDMNDAISIANAIVGAVTLTEEQKKFADKNGDGTVDINDVVLFVKVLNEKKKIEDTGNVPSGDQGDFGDEDFGL